MDDPVRIFTLISAFISTLSSSSKLIRRLRLRYIAHRRRRRLILLLLAYLRRKQNQNNIVRDRRSWSWYRPQYFFDLDENKTLAQVTWEPRVRDTLTSVIGLVIGRSVKPNTSLASFQF